MIDPKSVVRNSQIDLNGIQEFTSYLDGTWVEYLALAAWKNVSGTCNIHSYGMSLDTKVEPYDFELDVAAMQGYRLYAVSCTRSNYRPLIKSKLFEAFVRAAQLGGDEARVGLVCCDKSPSNLQKQVTRIWGATEGRIPGLRSKGFT